MAGKPGAPSVSTPRYNLAAALADPTFSAANPAQIEVPAPMMARLAAAQRVLLIGHTTPDGDCVGTTLAMARALKALGKQADVCVDDELGGQLRKIDDRGEVRRAAELAGRSWDLALIMDVSQRARIGGAAALLAHADAVCVADHHVAAPSRGDLGLAATTPLDTWVMPDYPAAALMAGALIARFAGPLADAGADLRAIYLPALIGFATDTGFGNYQGLDREYFRYFKFMAQKQAKVDLATLSEATRYALPEALAAFLTGTTEALPGPRAAAIAARQTAGTGLTMERHTDAAGDLALGLFSLTRAQELELLAYGRQDDPQLVAGDVVNTTKWARANLLRKEGAKVTVFLHEGEGGVRASVRSDGSPDLALHLAQHLGGGGHSMAAGAWLAGASLAEARAQVLAWCRDHGVL